MKKMSKTIFAFILGLVAAFTLDVAAEAVISSGAVSYGNTTVSAALDELFSAVDINELLGSTDISSIEGGTVTEILSKLYNQRSHVGMIVQSTTLDTMDKVKAIYGGTTWQKIEGRFLLGASSSYAVNGTGGSATNKLSVANLPSHTHSVGAHSHGLNNHTHSIPSLSGTANENYIRATVSKEWLGNDISSNIGFNDSATWSSTSGDVYGVSQSTHNHTVTTYASTTGAASGSTANSSAFNTSATGSGTAVNNMPPYKVVYIWERTA